MGCSLKFQHYRVENIDFRINEHFTHSEDESIPLNMKLHREIGMADNNHSFTVALSISIFDDAETKNYPFSLNSTVRGFFELDGAIDENGKQRDAFIERNSVAILFPYLRALVATITANSGVNQLDIPPINVVEMIENGDK
ncbi:protein-export chaperone SecB [Gottschalkiaceae bacterium SANA]|nr:protein-export chaperone SecB [Gottschalkiaceae bacterium SANA]